MIKCYLVADGKLNSSDKEHGNVLIYINPDTNEKRQLSEFFNIDDHTLSSTLDQDEVSRIEVRHDHLLLIWKRPKNYTGKELSFQFDVASLGALLFSNQLVMIASEEISLEQVRVGSAYPIHDPIHAMLEVLHGTIHHFLGHLKVIKSIAREMQQRINASMENVHLIQMFNLSESLIFYINAINTNAIVLERLRTLFLKQKASVDVVTFIDDLIIDNNQCYRQAEIYSSVLSGLMDARGNIVNNNMNVLLRNLTVINVVFLPLNLIASIGGMSEYTMMTHGMDWRLSYSLFSLALLIIGLLTALLIKKLVFVKQSDTSLQKKSLWQRLFSSVKLSK